MISYNFGQGPTFVTDASNQGYGCYLCVGDERNWQAGSFVDSNVLENGDILDPSHGNWKKST